VQVEVFERRQSRGQRRAGGFGVILHGWWRLYFVWWERLEYFSRNFSACLSTFGEDQE
jgi:hypothetical protein